MKLQGVVSVLTGAAIIAWSVTLGVWIDAAFHHSIPHEAVGSTMVILAAVAGTCSMSAIVLSHLPAVAAAWLLGFQSGHEANERDGEQAVLKLVQNG